MHGEEKAKLAVGASSLKMVSESEMTVRVTEEVSQIGQIACLPARWTDEQEENKVREYKVYEAKENGRQILKQC